MCTRFRLQVGDVTGPYLECENYQVEGQTHNKQINYTQDSSDFQRKKTKAGLGGIRTHDILQSRRVIYQLSLASYRATLLVQISTKRQTLNHCAIAQYTSGKIISSK